MKALKIFALLCFSAIIPASLSAQEKEDRIGTVNMQKLVDGYYKTAQTREEFKGYEKEIQADNDARVAVIKALVDEARKLQKQGEDPSLSREKKDELFKKAASKNQEAQGLVNARQEWGNQKQAALMEKLKVEFSALRAEIIAVVQKTGEEQGYDFILDRSGSSGAQVPILSYAKDATDLTATLLEIINKDAPAPAKDGANGSE